MKTEQRNPTAKKNILVAPLNWGLGHATRCIPIIKALEDEGFSPVLASDGAALELLRKEFPHLLSAELPSYNITYPAEGKNFKWKMLANMPRIFRAVAQETKITKRLIEQFSLGGIISDNRPGVRSKSVPSVYITHQVNVLSGNTSRISSKFHQRVIKKFDECWVPDSDGFANLSGKLGHAKNLSLNLRYIGPLSRFTKIDVPKKYDLMVLLSGPEPQRTLLGEILEKEIAGFDGSAIFVRGILADKQEKAEIKGVTYYNFMASDELGAAIDESSLVLCRPGYTTIMDLAKLGKKAFFIPTPGQFEQEYLAKKMRNDGFAPCARQERFRISNLVQADLYKGLPEIASSPDWNALFSLFKGE